METKGRDLDGRPNGLRMPWLTRLTVVEPEEDRLQTHEEESDDTPVIESENEPEEEVSVDN